MKAAVRVDHIDAKTRRDEADNAPPLSRTQRAELDRRLRDMKDPTRYVIVSPLFRRLTTLYDVASGNFAMGHWTESCLFKRRAEAEAVARTLSRRREKARDRFRQQVIAVTQTASGIRFLEAVKDPWHRGQTWKPRLRRTRIERAPKNADTTDTRAHILRGFIFTLDNFEEVARAIRTSRDRITASKRLQTRFSLSTRQADALLDLRLFHHTARERRSLKRELVACKGTRATRGR